MEPTAFNLATILHVLGEKRSSYEKGKERRDDQRVDDNRTMLGCSMDWVNRGDRRDVFTSHEKCVFFESWQAVLNFFSRALWQIVGEEKCNIPFFCELENLNFIEKNKLMRIHVKEKNNYFGYLYEIIYRFFLKSFGKCQVFSKDTRIVQFLDLELKDT